MTNDRELAFFRAEIQASLNRRYGTRHVVYDLALLRSVGQDAFDAHTALSQLHDEFGDEEVDMDRARKEPQVYLRILDRTTAKRAGA